MNLDAVKIIAKYFRSGDVLHRELCRSDWGPVVCAVDAEGYFHQQLNRPAIVSLSEQYFVFWNNRKMHRSDGPAVIENYHGSKIRLRWYFGGVLQKDIYIDQKVIPADLFKNYPMKSR